MPLIRYRKYSPRRVARGIINMANEILEEYVDQNLDLTLRQLHYQFVARDVYPDEWIDEKYNEKMGLDPETKNTDKNYDRLGDIVVAAREGGMIDWDHIKDRGRRVSKYSHWNDAKHFMRKVVHQFALDMWADQPKRVEVWVEKDALSQVVEQASDPFDVPTFATKGYMSASSAWDAGHNRYLKWAQDGQEIVILHLADHDPSGVHMSEDVRKRIAMFSSRYEEDQQRVQFKVKRIGLTMAQVRQYDPPSNPAKDSDSRKPAYEARYGNLSWELDALDPPVLVALIQKHIRKELDTDLYDACREREREHAELLNTAANHWDELVEHLQGLDTDNEDE